MLYIRPTGDGYEAFDIYHHPVFSETGCQRLFAFIEADASSLSAMLLEYFSSRIDEDTLATCDAEVPDTLCKDIKKEMANNHPFLSSNRYVTLFAMLAEHLNCAIYNSSKSSQPFSTAGIADDFLLAIGFPWTTVPVSLMVRPKPVTSSVRRSPLRN